MIDRRPSNKEIHIINEALSCGYKKRIAKGFLSSLFIWFELVLERFDQSVIR